VRCLRPIFNDFTRNKEQFCIALKKTFIKIFVIFLILFKKYILRAFYIIFSFINILLYILM